MSPLSFIDIHTHTLKSLRTLEVVNVIPGKTNIPENNFFSVGIHPWYVNDLQNQQQFLIEAVLNPKCIALGECGLDKVCTSPLKIQQEVFNQQCELAKKHNKPLIIHAVKAHFDVIAILKEHKLSNAVFHGFNARFTILEKILLENFYVSVGSHVLNSTSQIHALLNFIPKENLFFETDDAQIEVDKIYAVAAMQFKIPLEDLKKQIQENFTRFFNA